MRLTINQILLLSVAFVASNTSFADAKKGEARIDSLLKELTGAKDDTNKVKLLDEISFGYWYINTHEGLKYGEQALALARALHWKEGIARANGSIGGNYENQSDFANALKYEYASLKIYEELGEKNKEAMMLNNLSIVYRNHGDYNKAVEYDSLALIRFQELHDTDGIGSAYINIGNNYFNKNDFDRALTAFKAALEISKGMNDLPASATALGNIANACAALNRPSEALASYLKALRIYSTLGNKEGEARNIGNMGETYLDIARDTSGKITPDSLVPAGRSANLQKAIEYLDTAVKFSMEINRPTYIIEYSQSLSDACALAGDFKGALQAFKLYVAVRDSLSTLGKDKEFARNKLDYEYGKREDKLRFDKKLNEQRYIAGIAMLLLLLFFLYRYLRVQKTLNKVISSEKKRSDDLLLNILPSEVAQELKEKGAAEARLFDHVTVLFTDFVAFTKIAQRITPQELIDELHYCFRAFDEIMSKYGIEKIKTIGDAYLAVAGLPLADGQHAVHVVHAAIEINEFIHRRQEEKGHDSFEIRIGIHSGSVVAGIVGVKKFAYDIWGDTVNTAARMEQSSKAGKINISEATYQLVKDQFMCVCRGEIEAKNKGMMKMYFVEAGEI